QLVLDGRALGFFRFTNLASEGRKCIEKGDFASAEAYYTEALAIFSQDQPDFAETIKTLKELGRDSKGADYAEALGGLALAVSELGRTDEALDYFDEAIALEPSEESYYYNKGRLLQALNRPMDALQYYEEALRLAPDYYRAWNNKGAVLIEMKR